MNDQTAYLSLLLGMWFHTRELVGKPSVAEALGALKAAHLWTKTEREEIVCRLAAQNQIGDDREKKRAMWDDYFVPRGASA